MTYASIDCKHVNLLSMLAVFSVVISISGSVKYSDATHLPFSGPEREKEKERREGLQTIKIMDHMHREIKKESK